MQEEVENKSVAISIKATKLTANVLKAALLKALAEMEKKQKSTVECAFLIYKVYLLVDAMRSVSFSGWIYR